MKVSKYFFALFLLIVTFSFHSPNILSENSTPSDAVYETLRKLGAPASLHAIESPDPSLVQKGKEIVFNGRTTRSNGQKTTLQSKFFKCINCHNVKKESVTLKSSNPEEHLAFSDNSVSFLPGTTLYGTVNRTSWYNDDYKKKYGSLVTNARDTLINAIQLCATVCSQGRALDKWEMEAVLQYLWSISYKIADLGLTDENMARLNNPDVSDKDKIALITQSYAKYSPATFLEPIDAEERKYGASGNAQNGKVIYTQGCLSCHDARLNITNLKLDTSALSYNMLNRNLKKDNNFNLYNIVRRGTYPIPGYKPYMPHYTKERMTNQQIEDLIAFIKNASKK